MGILKNTDYVRNYTGGYTGKISADSFLVFISKHIPHQADELSAVFFVS